MTNPISQMKKLAFDIFSIVTSLDRMKALWRHPLYSNAIYIMSARAADAIVGFVFWIVAARLYSTEEVGQASALLSAATLLATLSGFGFGYGLVRFLGESKNPTALINSIFTAVTLAGTVAALVYVEGPGLWSPAVVRARQELPYLVMFVLAVPLAAMGGQADNTCIARRVGRFVLGRNLVFNSLRLVLPIVLAAYLHSFGLFASWGAAVLLSIIVSLFLFLPRAQPGYRFALAFDRPAVGHMFRFSFANYLADLFWSAPVLVLQSIVVANRLGNESNAYFAVAWAMGSVLISVPIAVSMSLFAEGSHDEACLGRSVGQSLKMTFLILTPSVTLVVLLAHEILLVFRPEYAENAATLLRLFAVSAFPVAVNYLYFGTMRVQRRMRMVVLLVALAGAATLALSYLLLSRMGITGAGVAWLVSQSCVALWVIGGWFKRRLTRS